MCTALRLPFAQQAPGVVRPGEGCGVTCQEISGYGTGELELYSRMKRGYTYPSQESLAAKQEFGISTHRAEYPDDHNAAIISPGDVRTPAAEGTESH